MTVQHVLCERVLANSITESIERTSMKHYKFKAKSTAIAMLASMFAAGPAMANGDGYEIWGSDQSNSVSGVASRGVDGSYMWIWDSEDVDVQLAGAIGSPNACRAVGNANGKNPISIIIPCHRVIGSDGRLTGYGGGLWRKEWLIKHERGYHPNDMTA